MADLDQRTITTTVLQAHRHCPSPRLRQILDSLVTHLHEFARDVRLTEEEWFEGIRFLTDVGHITDARRQEFILLSDVLGLSTLVTAQNHAHPAEFTESTVFGPFFVEHAPDYENGADIAKGAPGEPCFVSGTVRGPGGMPLPGAQVSVWQSDAEGLYDVQRPEVTDARARGNLRTLADGRFHFKSIAAAPYRIPTDGPVGRLLGALGRHPWRPAHLHFMITAPGYERLITHVFRSGGEYLAADAVFGVRPSLIADWARHEPGVAPDGTRQTRPFYTLHHDFVLHPEGEVR